MARQATSKPGSLNSQSSATFGFEANEAVVEDAILNGFFNCQDCEMKP